MSALVLITALVTLLVAAFVWWRFHFFHRNPARAPPPGDTLVCPADGVLLSVEEVDVDLSAVAYHRRIAAAFGVQGPYIVAATYLSIWDVHFVRSPQAGIVRLFPIGRLGKNLSMGASFLYTMLRRPLPLSRTGYRDKNEMMGLEINGVLLVLMADWWIDQIDTYVADGDAVERGQVVAKIFMGSQVDVFLRPDAFTLKLHAGDRTRAGEIALADLVRPSTPPGTIKSQ